LIFGLETKAEPPLAAWLVAPEVGAPTSAASSIAAPAAHALNLYL
jgi:hypothetical protein